MGFFTMNWKFFPIKAHYILFNAGTGTVQPTMPVYAKVLGFSSYVVGIIYTVLPILGLAIKPLFGGIADRFKLHRAVLVGCEITIILVYFGIWFIPPAHPHPYINPFTVCTADNKYYLRVEGNDTTWQCEANNTNYQLLCAKAFQDKCSVLEHPPDLKNCSQCLPPESDSDTYSQWQFWLFLVLLIAAWGGTSVVTTMSDTLCIQICETPTLYGQQRFWGSQAWGVLAIVNGLIIDAISVDGQEKNYAPAFYLMLAPLIIDIVVSYRLKFDFPEQSEHIAKDIWRIMLRPRHAVFMVWCILTGVSLALLWNFLYWLVEDLAAAQGASVTGNIKTIEGLISVVQCFLGETPSFFFGGWVISKIGHSHSITVVFALVGVRYVIYSYIANPWWFIPVELLQTYYGLFYTTMTSYAKEFAPPGTEATMQSVLCAAAEGIGVAIGSYIAGYYYDLYGGSVTFRIFGIFFIGAAVLSEVMELLLKYLDRRDAASQKKIGSSDVEVSGVDNPTFT